MTAENAQLAAALGNDYLVAPDVVVYRELYEDAEINQNQCIVDNNVSNDGRYKKKQWMKTVASCIVYQLNIL